MAKALKLAYASLYIRNEYMHELPDVKLKGLIIEETGQSEDSNLVALIMTCIKTIKKFVNFQDVEIEQEPERQNGEQEAQISSSQVRIPSQKLGFNLSYTINLNLPATSDIAVFNAIFKSLKENLLKGED